MKRAFLSGVLGVFILGSALAAAPTVKFTFSPVDLVDASGNVIVDDGTIRAGVKTTKRSMVVHCGYYTVDDKYAGEFQGDGINADGTVIDGDSASDVQTYCEQNFQNRQILPK
jgi:hypothetical protein